MVYVNQYQDTIQDAFKLATENLPDDHTKLVNDISDKICEQVSEKVRDLTTEYLFVNMADDIQRVAAKTAESMIMNALAGDDRELRNLFGFSDWYMKNLYLGALPTQWELIDKLMERQPDVFCNEKIAQQQAEIEQLRHDKIRLTEYIKSMRETT